MLEIFSPYIIAGAAGWLVAQVAKYLVASIKNKQWPTLRQLYLSGNMPSSHSATVVAVLIVIAFKDGVGSGLFGLAVLVAAVVMYDAVMVRRSSGEQGIALTEILKEMIKEKKTKITLPRVAKGHTPLEVAVGAIVGWVIGLGIVWLMVL